MTDHALAGLSRDTDLDREHALQDELLRRIDENDLVPRQAFSAMVETLARLRELPDHLAWFATRYLQACVIRGHKMFPGVQQAELGLAVAETTATIPCVCGHDTPVDHLRTWRNNRTVEAGECPGCLTPIARWDGEPYPRPTLYAPGLT